MAITSLNADSTSLTLNEEAFNDFIDGDYIEIAPVNPLTSRINGSGDSVNITKRTDGNVFDVTVRFIRYSDSDIAMNAIVNSVNVVVLGGTVKESYTKDGAASKESWVLTGGSITDQPTEVKNNQDGNAAMEYKIQCRAIRNI